MGNRCRHSDGISPIVPRQIRNVGRIADGNCRHRPRHIADVVRPATLGFLHRRLQLFELDRKTLLLFCLCIFLDDLRKSLFFRGPFGQANSLDVRIGGFCDRSVEVPRGRSANDAARYRRVRHLGGGFRDHIANVEAVLDPLEILFAEEVPDRRHGGDDVWLVATIADDIV